MLLILMLLAVGLMVVDLEIYTTWLLVFNNSIVLCWFGGQTTNDTSRAITWTLPYSYKTNYRIVGQPFSDGITSSNQFRTNPLLMTNKTNTNILIHYYVDKSYVVNFDAITIGF